MPRDLSACLPSFSLDHPRWLDRRRLFAEWSRVDRHARAHGGADGGALNVLALGYRRLGLDYGRDQAGRVLDELGGIEADLADRCVNDAGLIDAEFHFAGLNLMDRLGHIRGNGAGLG